MSSFNQVFSIFLLKIAIGLSYLKMKKTEAQFHLFCCSNFLIRKMKKLIKSVS